MEGFGCVTSGETWQFLRLEDQTLTFDARRYFLVEVESILGIFQAILALFPPTVGTKGGR